MTMEKRTVLAVVLMTAFFIVYQWLFLPAPPRETPPAERAATPPAVAPPAPVAAVPVPGPVTPPATSDEGSSAPPQRLVSVTGPLFRAVVSSEGGKLQELVLRYRGEKPMIVTGELGPGGLLLRTRADAPPEPVAMTIAAEALSLTPQRPAGDLVLSGTRDGLNVRETLRFHAESYVIGIDVRVENPGPEPRTVAVVLPWITRQSWRETPERFTGQHPTEIVYAGPRGVERAHDLCAVPDVSQPDGAWVATGSTWYMGALVPRTGGFGVRVRGEAKACDAKDRNPVGRATAALEATPTIAAGQAWEGQVLMFVGPKEYDRLQAVGLEATLDFGGFPLPRSWGGLPMEWLGVPILLLMKWVYHHVGNYGVAIILLTVVSKVLFYPLTLKGLRSMKAMQTLQPQVNALRSKYRSDPQRLQKETLELYREHKVNPLGGCLPMLSQIPIFYALYLALSVSVELQNAAFLCFGRLFGRDLWICDLASHDPTYILPILMGVTMFVQQKMTPVMGDPRQARMMLLMPFVFTFMFLNLPSGLVLYWTVSNVLQIGQQVLMNRSGDSPARVPSRA